MFSLSLHTIKIFYGFLIHWQRYEHDIEHLFMYKLNNLTT
jgi:hypothetical protein